MPKREELKNFIKNNAHIHIRAQSVSPSADQLWVTGKKSQSQTDINAEQPSSSLARHTHSHKGSCRLICRKPKVVALQCIRHIRQTRA